MIPRAGAKLAAGAAKHICVNADVHPELERLRNVYANLPPILTEYAGHERHRLTSFALAHQLSEAIDTGLTVCYLPQLGFMLKLPTECINNLGRDFERTLKDAGLHLQFEVTARGSRSKKHAASSSRK